MLEWTRAHNERFEIRFATTSAIAADRVVAGEGYSLEIGTDVSCVPESPVSAVVLCSWAVPDPFWTDVLGLRDRTPDGVVYWVVLARDALGRNTFSRVRSPSIVRRSSTDRTVEPDPIRGVGSTTGNGNEPWDQSVLYF